LKSDYLLLISQMTSFVNIRDNKMRKIPRTREEESRRTKAQSCRNLLLETELDYSGIRRSGTGVEPAHRGAATAHWF
jgi:hypothetical protein